MVAGRYLHTTNAPEIIIGSALARNLKVSVGDEITLLGSAVDGSFAAGIVTVVGVFESGMLELDRQMAQLPLGYFRQLFALGDAGHAVVMRAPSLQQVALMQQQVAALLPAQGVALLDWEALVPGLKQAVQADFVSAWFMYAVLVVLVAFSVLNTQLMSVLERTHEFGTMMALGLAPGRLAGLVLLETYCWACCWAC
jgi:ABC-type lipoprotein release transport system permease subunit